MTITKDLFEDMASVLRINQDVINEYDPEMGVQVMTKDETHGSTSVVIYIITDGTEAEDTINPSGNTLRFGKFNKVVYGGTYVFVVNEITRYNKKNKRIVRSRVIEAHIVADGSARIEEMQDALQHIN